MARQSLTIGIFGEVGFIFRSHRPVIARARYRDWDGKYRLVLAFAAYVSGVMFTPQLAGARTWVEALRGLGLSIAGGTVTPDPYEVESDQTVSRRVGSKQTRIALDTERGGVATKTVSSRQQRARTLNDDMVLVFAALGTRIARIQDSIQDVEWAVIEGTIWILQARPFTARAICGPFDSGLLEPGDIVVCPYADPA